MRRAVRLALAVLGLDAAVYAGATLTGHVEPPWWLRRDLTEQELKWE